MRYFVGIDNGGTFSKAAVFDETGTQIAVETVHTTTPEGKGGCSERNMDELWNANVQAIRNVLIKSKIPANHIAAVSLSGHGKGAYLTDKEGNPICGITSQDVRARQIVSRWKQNGTAEAVYKKTMQAILPCQPVSLLAWLQENEPKVLESAAYLFSVKDYIRFKLTGEAYGDYTDFSGGNLLDLGKQAYDYDLMKEFGIEECYRLLPPLRRSEAIAGYVTREVADMTLLPEGVPVATGLFDVDACGIGAGLVTEEEICAIAGTWSINQYISCNPVTDGSIELNSLYCIPGFYLVEESSPTSAGNLEWFVRNMLKDIKEPVYAYVNAAVEHCEPEASDLVFLPFLYGNFAGSECSSALVGLKEYHSHGAIFRAVYEGVVFSHVHHIRKLKAGRKDMNAIRLAGGAAKSRQWVQIFADALQMPVKLVGEKELGCLGAAVTASIAAGVYRDYGEAVQKMVSIEKTVMPDPAKKTIYDLKYERFKDCMDCVTRIHA